MKKYFIHLLLVLGLGIQTDLLAGTFIIKGTVTDDNRRPLAGKVLYISAESGAPGCNLQKKVQTNANGFYIDSVSCGGEIRFITVQTTDCNGRMFMHRMIPGSTRVIESNFVLCGSTVTMACNASFTIVPITSSPTLFQYGFLSANSKAAPGDSIVARTWLFGDRTAPVTGNEINVRHAFPGPGNYQVTLLIKTQRGCESKITNTVVVKEQPCSVISKVFIKRQAGLYLQFSSVEDNLAAGDSIIKRSWTFGDGSSIDGNEISPVKKYKDSGTYRVCLQFKTKYGCTGEACIAVRVKDSSISNTACRAFFTTKSEGLAVWFSSEQSNAGAMPNGMRDSIISRSWYINDTLVPSTSNNLVVLRQLFERPGNYKIKLVIKTRSGCESKLEQSITLLNQNCNLSTKAVVVKSSGLEFLFERLVTNVNNGDSIVSTIWKFGDGTSLDQSQGRPYKAYRQAGKYTVCVYTRTARGCSSEACVTVEAKDSFATPVDCKALFSYEVKDSVVYFNSGRSTASGGVMGTNGDSIVQRIWYFGSNTRGIEVPGNQESIRHIFNQPGTYPVILYIKTKKGCESKFVANVVILPIQCRFETKIAVGRYNALNYKFNSTHSNLSSSDSIVKRSWSFGDGTYNEGNEANPLKTYAKAGKYKVCLVAKSLKGCRSESCIEIEIKDSTVLSADCFAFFSYEIDNNVVKLNSSRSRSSNIGLSSAPDTIISRTWYFGNNARGIEVPGNQWDMKYAYDQPGTYTITLVIKTRQGCESKYTTTIIIRPADCRFETRIGVGRQSGLSYQFRAEHAGLIAGDSIVKRSWNFGDGTFNEGNDERPVKTYTKAGKYKVCLVAKSRRGCVSESCFEINVSDSSIAPYNCKALFEYSINGTVVYFNSAASTGAPTIGGTNDSIISRTWYLGNATSGPTYGGNEVEVKFDYLKPGTYTAYLVIKTRSGCESKYAVTFTIQPICKAVADFKFEQTAPNRIQFASGASTTTSGDTITQRIWSFGDNSLMTGNVVNPEKVYRTAGTYRVCLQVKTSKGCVADVCKDVRVLDTTNTPGIAINYLKIVSINPNPVQTKMAVTVWSRLPNISTEFTVYDVNGNPKMSFKKELASGNNILEISADRLNPGLYFLRVGNAYGRDSAQFYKQ